MGAILDIIGSYVFKAAMIGIIIATSINLNEVMVEKNQLAITEKNLNVAISIIEWDLKNIGYPGTTSPPWGSTMILSAGAYNIQYQADVQNDGTWDLVSWNYTYRGYDEEVGYIYDLVRTVNGVSYTVIQRLYYDFTDGFVSWRFRYLNADGNETSTLSSIKGIKVFIKTKSDFKVNGEFLTAEREFTVYPPNLSL